MMLELTTGLRAFMWPVDPNLLPLCSGIEIWRIEKFKVVKWPLNKYGTFFSGEYVSDFVCCSNYLIVVG